MQIKPGNRKPGSGNRGLLNHGPGKGSTPRTLLDKNYRDRFDAINWPGVNGWQRQRERNPGRIFKKYALTLLAAFGLSVPALASPPEGRLFTFPNPPNCFFLEASTDMQTWEVLSYHNSGMTPWLQFDFLLLVPKTGTAFYRLRGANCIWPAPYAP